MAQTCCNCHHPARRLTRGRCDTCYGYLMRHGRERPAHLWQTCCSDCGRSPVHALGFCNTCYSYRRKHNGQGRPLHMREFHSQCKNPACRKPITRESNVARRGYCIACYHYRRRNGRQRPPELAGGPGPWCDCGRRATRRLIVGPREKGSGRGYGMELQVCEGCWGIEIEFEQGELYR